MKRQKEASRGRESNAGVTGKIVATGFFRGLGAAALVTSHTIPNREHARYSRDGLKADWRKVGNALKKAHAETI